MQKIMEISSLQSRGESGDEDKFFDMLRTFDIHADMDNPN
jgi:hypothetical protein